MAAGVRWTRLASAPPRTTSLSCCPARLKCSFSTSSSVDTLECATKTAASGSRTFNFCPNSALNCQVTLSGTHPALTDYSRKDCSVYSVYSKPPAKPGTKRYVLSTGIIGNGTPSSLDSAGFCTSEGYEFAVVSSFAEMQLLNQQLGGKTGAIWTRCSGPCLAWHHLNISMYWSDGTPLNDCEIKLSTTSGPCRTQEWYDVTIHPRSCSEGTIPVICQVYD
ncbi:uncharacterized protein LOC108677280 [Hyalella azteca]|uniref:Uncharacterized protein LOC108677280 n=1 Tax=Hyalella azteca TaxID=294128 RepID=A0A979FXE7_HYAAZ|nr:uncharacterized protein LOC108677280 [Hyalella azteca]